MVAKDCPNCHHLVKNDEAEFCPVCGYALGISRRRPGESEVVPAGPIATTAEAEAPPGEAPPGDAELWVQEVFAPIGPPTEPSGPGQTTETRPRGAPPSRRRRSRTWIALVCILVLVVTAAVAIALTTRGGSASSTTVLAQNNTSTTVKAASSGPSATTTSAPPVTTTSSPASTTTSFTTATSTVPTVNEQLVAYKTAADALAQALQEADTRIPALATEINSTLPNVPPEVVQELTNLRLTVVQGLEGLHAVVMPSQYSKANAQLENAEMYMEQRIDATIKGVQAAEAAQSVTGGNTYFAEGRKDRDLYKAAFRDYQADLAQIQ
jgi:hypothetical protein